ncbi:MAG TPA: DUF3553 domain-containing protein [Ferrovibrio sp.]|jgi:hypothetical protein|uniref:DUF3553 domain-containing protein n=1 Tax=Ferrovibrio sp. TaxID=1917215 RepID=UPI002B4AB7F7|nr:DUF3553 domain-containing protein [Ferrovibrio sp.]HLT76261.1 DUF3553 domain-containing protein [Ferrovibrio sp.]
MLHAINGKPTGMTMLAPYAPGDWVENPLEPDWGPGQVQSAIGARVTVNFLHAGKRLINTDQVPLVTIDEPDDAA